MYSLKGKTALVTGSSRGIGRQIAKGLASLGCDVILHASKIANLTQTQADLSDYDVKVYTVAGDLGDPSSLAAMLETIDTRLPAVDIVYNNAGISCEPQTLYQIDRVLMAKIMEVNVYSLMTICNHFLPKMQEAGYGRIINFTSGVNRMPELEPYAISKASVDKYTQDMAVLLEGSNVLMNLVTPGWVRTDMGGEEATMGVETVLPGVLVPALINEDGPCGRLYQAPAYSEMTLEEAMDMQ